MYSLTSVWTIQKGKEAEATAALKRLAEQVKRKEADTLAYLVHTPDMTQPSLPTPSHLEVVFFEIYKNEKAFLAHVNGPVFQGFVKEHGNLFLSMAPVECGDGQKVVKPFTTVEFLERKAGFIRPQMAR